MSTENQTVQTPKESFVPQFLIALQSAEPRELQRIKNFFSEAFLLLTEEPFFDESDYRREWANNINSLNDLCIPFKGLSDTQIDNEIEQALTVLEARFNTRKEVAHV